MTTKSPKSSGTEPTGTRRRTIVTGAAWTIPVIATVIATPAHAASPVEPCNPAGSLNWANNYTRTSANAGSGVALVTDGRTVPFTVSSFGSANISVSEINLQTGPNYLIINGRTTAGTPNRNYDATYTVRTTVTFATPVSNLRFTVGDTDGTGSREFTAVLVGGSIRLGTPGSALILGGSSRYYNGVDGDVDNLNAPSHNIVYNLAGPITSFVVEYTRKSSNAGNAGGIVIGNMNYDLPC